MPASGEIGADLDVGRGARQRAGVREAVQQRHDDLHQPWPHSSLLGLNGVPRLSASRSAMREQSRLSTAGDEHDRDRRSRPGRPEHVGVQSMQPRRREHAEVGGDRAVLVLTRVRPLSAQDRRGQQRADADRDQRRRDERRDLQQVLGDDERDQRRCSDGVDVDLAAMCSQMPATLSKKP